MLFSPKCIKHIGNCCYWEHEYLSSTQKEIMYLAVTLWCSRTVSGESFPFYIITNVSDIAITSTTSATSTTASATSTSTISASSIHHNLN